jgi:hypothetical protein
MPGLEPGIHVFLDAGKIDGRVKPGHDDEVCLRPFSSLASAALKS